MTFLLRRKAEIVGTVMHERKRRGVRQQPHAQAVECVRVKTPFVGLIEHYGLEPGAKYW
jgi:hypothetical protein